MNKKLKPPRNIYLQNYFQDFGFYDEGVTWCEDKQNDDDIEYILQSEYDKINKEKNQLQNLLKEAYQLSTWTACINFDGSRNEIGWCKDLYQKLENFQEHYENLGLEIPKGTIPFGTISILNQEIK